MNIHHIQYKAISLFLFISIVVQRPLLSHSLGIFRKLKGTIYIDLIYFLSMKAEVLVGHYFNPAEYKRTTPLTGSCNFPLQTSSTPFTAFN
jgi:hypothetical protein